MKNIDSFFKKASLFLESNNFKKALKLFKKSYANGFSEAGLNIGYIYDKMGKKKKAIKWYKKLLKRQQDTNVMLNLAILYKESYKIKKAKKYLKKALKLGDGDASLELAKIYLCEAKIKKAEKYLKLVINNSNSCDDSKEEAEKLIKRLEKTRK